jgi:hypothetical protein
MSMVVVMAGKGAFVGLGLGAALITVSGFFFFPSGLVVGMGGGWLVLLTEITVTGIFLAEAAATLLQEDVGLPGGVYTPACLGQPFIERLNQAGFHIETKRLEP